MWKKPESDEALSKFSDKYSSESKETHVQSVPVKKGSSGAAIGPSISISGDVSGEEDLLILGKVEGKIELKKNNVTVGASGDVKADIYAHTVTVEGKVDGSIYGGEKVAISQKGFVRGNIVAPRVHVEDGATFQGSIDMEGAAKNKSQTNVRPIDNKYSENNKTDSSTGKPGQKETKMSHGAA